MEKEKLIWKTNEISLNVTAGKIDSYRRTEETKNTVRVYEDGKIGIAGSLGEIDEAALTESAKKALSYGIEYPCELHGNTINVDDAHEIIPQKEFIPKMQGFLDRITKECSNFTVSDKIKLSELRHTYENSKGAHLFSSSSWLEFSLIFQNKGAGNLFDASYEGYMGEFDENAAVRDCKLLHDSFYKNVDITEGVYPVFMLSEVLLVRTIDHFFANTYASGASLLSGKIGEKVFNEKFTMYDDRSHLTCPPACVFDDEGEFAPDFKQVFVKNGVLTNVLTNKMYSKIFNLPSAATAGATYDGVPQFTALTCCTEPTASSAAEITKEKSILVMMASGGDMTPAGHFATPVQLAFLVENGEIVGKLPDIGISGEYFELLGKDYLGTAEKAFFPSLRNSYMACRMKVTK